MIKIELCIGKFLLLKKTKVNYRLFKITQLEYSKKKKVKVKCSRYRPGVAQRVRRGIVLLFHDRGTRRGEWSAARHGRTLPPGKEVVPILQETGWAPGPN